MDMFNLINKKKIIKKKLKGYTNEKSNIINNIIKNNNEDEDERERITLIKMNIDELTKLLKVINIMIKNYNTIENIIDFQNDYY
jgi:hypothetical protein